MLGSVTTSVSRVSKCVRVTSLFRTLATNLSAGRINKEETPNTMGLDPLQSRDYFGVRNLVTTRDLVAFRCHLGHKSALRNDYMSPYLFGCRQEVDIIDMDQTLHLLGDALNFTAHVAHRGGIILFVSRNRMLSPLVERTAQECKEYSHTRVWGGPVFTDADKYFGVVTRLPDLLIFLHTLNHMKVTHSALRDANKLLIPSTGLVDSDCDPRLVDYPVPCNDDSPSSVRFMAALFSEAIMRGKGERVDLTKTIHSIGQEHVATFEDGTLESSDMSLKKDESNENEVHAVATPRRKIQFSISQRYIRGKSIRWKYRDQKKGKPIVFNVKP